MRKSLTLTVFTILLAVAASARVQTFTSPNSDSGGFYNEESSSGSYLGVDTRDVTSDRLSALHLKDERGVEVTMVDQDAPAGKAGIKEHDVILTLNGTAVESVEQLRRLIREIPPGRTVTLEISRDGQPVTLKAELASRRKAYAYSYGPDGKDFHFEMPAMPAIPAIPAIPALPPDIDYPSVVVVHVSTRSGLMIENLTPQLGDYFGVKNGQGVLVRSVEKGSRAEKAGFRAGDVIVRVNGEPINDSSDFGHALRGRKDNTASVSIVRDKKEQTITLPLPDRNHSQVIDESLDWRDFSVDLSELNSELARLKPEIAAAVRVQTAEARRIAPEIARQVKEYRGQEEQIKKQMLEMRRQMRDYQRELTQEYHNHCTWI